MPQRDLILVELTERELRARTLADCEEVIGRGLGTFVEVGQALAYVRDGALYRETHDTFENYCRERWGLGRNLAYKQIAAAEVCTTVHTAGLPAPTSEGVARELVPLRDKPRLLRKVWERATSASERPTAAEVKAIRGEVLPPRKIKPTEAPAHVLQHMLAGTSPEGELHEMVVKWCDLSREIAARLDEGVRPALVVAEEIPVLTDAITHISTLSRRLKEILRNVS